MAEELRHCPFCGGKAKYIYYGEDYNGSCITERLKCRQCGAHTNVWIEGEATSLWNDDDGEIFYRGISYRDFKKIVRSNLFKSIANNEELFQKVMEYRTEEAQS